MAREPAVAGTFYPKNKSQLIEMIEHCFSDTKIGPGKLPDKSNIPTRQGEITGVIAPHAGYIYSGPVAAHAYLKQFQDGKPEFFVIIGPNHRNIGPTISVYSEAVWKTPLGEAQVPSNIVEKIVKQPYFRADSSAHMLEHSIEVHIPFLQYLYGADVPIIPICVRDQSKEMSERIGLTLAKVLADHDYCLIASTDLTHFESSDSAISKDQFVLQKIKRLDSKGLLDTVEEYRITMCGPGPVAAVLTALKKAGSKNVEILKYSTSGEITGDKNSVVAYMSAIVKK